MRVTVRVEGNNDASVQLAVHNLGVIPSDLLPEIFEPLQSSNDRKYEGSSGLGLGLYISRQIAEAHAGTIMSPPRSPRERDSSWTCQRFAAR